MNVPSEFVSDLADVGCHVDRVEGPWGLVNRKSPYRDAVPVLLKWLEGVDGSEESVSSPGERFREGLVRALAVKEARGAAASRALVREFQRSELNWTARWAVANSLSVVADDSIFDDLVVLVKDQSYGRAREMLTSALVRADKERSGEVLIRLLEDDELVGHAIVALRQAEAIEAQAKVVPFVGHHKEWVRKEAKKAVAKFSA